MFDQLDSDAHEFFKFVTKVSDIMKQINEFENMLASDYPVYATMMSIDEINTVLDSHYQVKYECVNEMNKIRSRLLNIHNDLGDDDIK